MNGQKQQKLLFAVIMLGLLIWGSYHAIGAYRSGNMALLKAAITLGFFLLFLGFWGSLLWIRHRRLQRVGRQSITDATPQDDR